MTNPIKNDYIGLGEGRGIKVTLWPTSLMLERVKREYGKWKTQEKITLAPKVLEWLGVRIPGYVSMMDAQK